MNSSVILAHTVQRGRIVVFVGWKAAQCWPEQQRGQKLWQHRHPSLHTLAIKMSHFDQKYINNPMLFCTGVRMNCFSARPASLRSHTEGSWPVELDRGGRGSREGILLNYTNHHPTKVALTYIFHIPLLKLVNRWLGGQSLSLSRFLFSRKAQWPAEAGHAH